MGRFVVVSCAVSIMLAQSTSPAAAQPVNAEVLQTNLFQEDWSGSITGSFALSRGNVEIVDIGGAGRVQYQTLHPTPDVEEGSPPPIPFLRQRVFLRASARFSEQRDTDIFNQGFSHLRWSGMWHPRVGPDLFTQFQFNQLQRLRMRALFGAGARVDIVHEPKFLLWGASGYMYERERIDVQDGAPDSPRSTAHRWASYVTARVSAVENRFLLQNTIFIQPRFDEFGDFRLLDELEAIAKVTDLFAFGINCSVQHDNRPPTGVKKTDLRLATTVTLTL